MVYTLLYFSRYYSGDHCCQIFFIKTTSFFFYSIGKPCSCRLTLQISVCTSANFPHGISVCKLICNALLKDCSFLKVSQICSRAKRPNKDWIAMANVSWSCLWEGINNKISPWVLISLPILNRSWKKKQNGYSACLSTNIASVVNAWHFLLKIDLITSQMMFLPIQAPNKIQSKWFNSNQISVTTKISYKILLKVIWSYV